MHPNKTFRQTAEAKALHHAGKIGFGMLAVSAAPAPLLSHVPFLLAEDGHSAELHLVRSNPIARLAAPLPARLAVQGPHGYVSPDWYEVADQVPTWNYTAVHLTGTLEQLPPEALPLLLARLSDRFEAELAPKPIWKMSKMDSAALEKMLRQIVPFRLHIEDVQSTFKLSQNKPDKVRLRAADALEKAATRADAAQLSALMRRPPTAEQAQSRHRLKMP